MEKICSALKSSILPRPFPPPTAQGPEQQEPSEPTGAKELFLSREVCPGFVSFAVTVSFCLFVLFFFNS